MCLARLKQNELEIVVDLEAISNMNITNSTMLKFKMLFFQAVLSLVCCNKYIKMRLCQINFGLL